MHFFLLFSIIIFLPLISSDRFFSSQSISAPEVAFDVCSGDLDGDGDIDFASLSSFGVFLYYQIGLNERTYNRLFFTSTRGIFIYCADVDGDSDIDLTLMDCIASTYYNISKSRYESRVFRCIKSND